MTHMPRPRPTRVKHLSNGFFFYASRATAAFLVMVAMAAIGVLVVATLAQDTTETPASSVPNNSSSAAPYAAYFIAADSDGIQQVWGLTLPDGQSKMLTDAAQSVSRYAISADATQIAYVSDNQIWRQTLGHAHALEAVAVVAVETVQATLAVYVVFGDVDRFGHEPPTGVDELDVADHRTDRSQVVGQLVVLALQMALLDVVGTGFLQIAGYSTHGGPLHDGG